MLKAFELERLKDQRFYSEKVKGFVEIKGTVFTFNDTTIDLNNVSVLDTETQELISNILYESDTKYRIEKRTSRAFGKDIFLLGEDQYGKLMWLEAPKWDCGWYWGFGYVETYTNNAHPSRARDIDGHSHFDGLVGYQEYYDHEKGCFRKGEYIHNVYDSPKLVKTTFTSKEGWELSELMKQFYLLREMAEFCHKDRPGCNITTSPVEHGTMTAWYKHINEVMIPKITAEVMRMLSPTGGKRC